MIPGERYVVLGLAPPRAAWFRSVGVWSTSGALPAEFLKCVSAEEARARLASGRPFSALVADSGLPTVDRDLLAAAAAADCAVLVVDDGRAPRDWVGLGAARVLTPSFTREELVTALSACARTIRRGETPAADLLARPTLSSWRGTVVAVTGPGGTGAVHRGHGPGPGPRRRRPSAGHGAAGRPAPQRRAGHAPRRPRRRPRHPGAGGGPPLRAAVDRRRPGPGLGRRRASLPPAARPAPAPLLARPCARRPSRPPSTPWAGPTGWSCATSTPTSRERTAAAPSTWRSAT